MGYAINSPITTTNTKTFGMKGAITSINGYQAVSFIAPCWSHYLKNSTTSTDSFIVESEHVKSWSNQSRFSVERSQRNLRCRDRRSTLIAQINSEGSREDNSGTENPNSSDKDASDLSLPDLKELFAEGGDPGCEQCEGKGTISCPVCNGKGYFSLTMMDTTSATTCRMCRGRRSIPCPSCREAVFKSILWWDRIPSEDEDPNEDWRNGPDGPRIEWGGPPTNP